MLALEAEMDDDDEDEDRKGEEVSLSHWRFSKAVLLS